MPTKTRQGFVLSDSEKSDESKGIRQFQFPIRRERVIFDNRAAEKIITVVLPRIYSD